MKNRLRLAVPIAASCLLLAAGATARGAETPPAPARSPAPPAGHAAPGPEHALLKRWEGTWDAAVEIRPDPKAPPMTSRGAETAALGCGGLWLLSDFKSASSEQPFHGHGMLGYSTARSRYVAVWVDSDLTAPMISEGTYDAARRTLTLKGEAPGPDGRSMRWRQEDVFKDDNTRVYTMYMSGADGKENPTLTITYRRRS